METLIGTVGQWLAYGLIIGVLLLMFIMLMRGSKVKGDLLQNRAKLV